MSHQEIFINPSATLLYHKRRAEEIRNSPMYLAEMADHYRLLYIKRRRGRLFSRAVFAFIKWQYYEKKLIEIKLEQLCQHCNINLLP